MSEKIAVHCKTEKEWDAVEATQIEKEKRWAASGKKSNPRSNFLYDFSAHSYDSRELCMNVSDDRITANVKTYWGGYTIIPASEYLKREEEEFKVGDRVECIKDFDEYVVSCETGTIVRIDTTYPEIGVRWDTRKAMYHDCEGSCSKEHGFFVDRKIIALINQPKTTEKEESKMSKSIQINNTVARVFPDIPTAELVTIHLGDEYPENNHRAYLDLTLNKESVLAEAKRLDKEEKEDAQK